MKFVLLTISWLFFLNLISQDGHLVITGKMKIPNPQNHSKSEIVVSENKKVLHKIPIDEDLNFKFRLPVGPTYKILYKSKKCVSKFILINSSEIPFDDLHKGEAPMNLEVTLFKKCKKSRFNFLKRTAVGEFFFDPETGYMEYDGKKAREIRNLIQKEQEKCKD